MALSTEHGCTDDLGRLVVLWYPPALEWEPHVPDHRFTGHHDYATFDRLVRCSGRKRAPCQWRLHVV
eukprot:1000837-Alexandrium_andersonii.AAC.1